MSNPLLFHILVGAVMLAIGVWLLKRRRRVLGWTLTWLGSAFAVMGFVFRAVHRYLHH
jgi:hypothetical protein